MVSESLPRKNKIVSEYPEPRARFRTFDESQLSLQLLCWIDYPSLRGKVIDQINSEIYKSFQENGINIPFPQRTVHLVQSKK